MIVSVLESIQSAMLHPKSYPLVQPAAYNYESEDLYLDDTGVGRPVLWEDDSLYFCPCF